MSLLRRLIARLLTRENVYALMLCLIVIVLIIVTTSSAPQWIYANF